MKAEGGNRQSLHADHGAAGMDMDHGHAVIRMRQGEAEGVPLQAPACIPLPIKVIEEQFFCNELYNT